MKKLSVLFVLSLILLLVFNSLTIAESIVIAPEEQNNSLQQQADLEVFVREGCPHCADAEAFLHTLQKQLPSQSILIRDISKDPSAFERLQLLAKKYGEMARVPAFFDGEQLLIGYTNDATTGQWLRNNLERRQQQTKTSSGSVNSGSCEAEQTLSCEAPHEAANETPTNIDFLGYRLSVDQIGLPLFTIAIGLLDGFNPCSLWVLILMISLLAPMNNRFRMFAIAGTFIAVQGVAYFLFMTAWLNLFLFIGLSRISEIIIAVLALLAGLLNLKDFWIFGRGFSLSIPDSAKPGIYARMRNILTAKNFSGALVGAVLLAVLVQLVELLCTSGFPALYTRILTLQQLNRPAYYSYLILYNLAYMLDDLIILSIGIVTLSQKRLQDKEGKWLKLISGLAMIGLAVYLFFE